MKKHRILVLGGGASGLAAAVTASKNPQNEVTVIEKNARTGKKILLSGNGRCNLSNKIISAENYNDENFFTLWNTKCPPDRVLGFFRDLGVYLSEDAQGRIYPATNAANSVLDALRLRAAQNGVIEQTDTEIVKITKTQSGFSLTDKKGGIYTCDSLIVACGSSSGGAKIDAGLIGSLGALGHKFVPFSPVLTPLKTSRDFGALKNQREKARLTLYCGGQKLGQTVGEVQFREKALSGISVFETAFFRNKYIKNGGSADNMVLSLDFVPEIKTEDLTVEIERRMKSGYTKETVLTGIAANRVAIFASKDLPPLADALKQSAFSITGTAGTDEAQVCDGGFEVSGIDSDMHSKSTKRLFFTGECLNFAGNSGGYNLHAAWATGIIAGEKLCGKA